MAISEKIPEFFERAMSHLEMRIMSDIVRAIKINGFSTATADIQFQRLIELGKSEKEIKEWIRDILDVTDEEIERIYSDEVYKEYYKYERLYHKLNKTQIPFEDNVILQQLIVAVKNQTKDTFKNLSGSLGFVKKNPVTGKIIPSPLMEEYQDILDSALLDLASGAFNYDKVIGRAINELTSSGLRWIDYESGYQSRANVAARRAITAGFRQIQSQINEQVAAELGTDSFEVSYHMGARPEHQVWQGRVYTYKELQTVCHLGEVTGLCGANCYHTYEPFVEGVSQRTYTDAELESMMEKENKPVSYGGKKYTVYQATQRQRYLETSMRKVRQDIKLLEEGGASKNAITNKKIKYRTLMGEYESFSAKMKLPMQKSRIYQDSFEKHLTKKKSSGIIKSGAVSGARNPYGKAANEHAKKYYGLVRSMTTDVKRIAEATGYSEQEIREIKNFIFIDKHDLGEQGVRRFEPDYMMGESWRRLIAGKPETHDLTLINHEIMEKKLIQEGMSQEEAHIKTSAKYNYDKEAREFYGKIKKYKKDR